ncbi:MAG: 3-oxoacyl-ACP reductase [Actinobacteria bacterium]|nr:3-oxoacyl-ACP reductase [Actinomycetota bacterium]
MQRRVGEVGVRQPQLVAVVEVGHAWQGELQQCRRPAPGLPARPAAVARRDPVDVVVVQYPGGRGADAGHRRHRPFDRRAHLLRRPRGLDELEVERQVQLVRPHVAGESGRVVVLGRAADGADVAVDATRQALDGIVRSLAKELRRGATANLLWVEDEASLASALRFLLSGKSAYVDGQPLRLGAGEAPDPVDWERPLAGKTALVTGAARGIGAAIAGVLARDGAHVIAADLTQAGEALAKVANRLGGTALHLDVASPDAPQRLLDHLAAHTDGLDVLIHNAGITRDKLLANMKPEQWDSVIAVNLESQLRINAALLGSDQLNAQSRVVCLSSTTGLSGNRGQTNYGATKAGVIGLVRASAAAFAAHGGSTINAIAPGFIDTEMTAKMPLATREVARRLSSLQQAGLPVDVAEAAAWLSSPGAGGVNGQVLRVCGQNLVGA